MRLLARFAVWTTRKSLGLWQKSALDALSIAGMAGILALGLSSVFAAAPVPRKSPEFIVVDSSGGEMSLSSFKGEVVVVEFLLIQCPHCLRVAQTINKLHGELGSRGFHAVGVTFDNGIAGPAVGRFEQLFKLNYPLGYTTSDKVDRYLGRAMSERFQVPQIVVIDRAGVVRAQSRPVGEADLEDESYLRNLIDELLKEDVPPANGG
jgi:peroxiredoxin